VRQIVWVIVAVAVGGCSRNEASVTESLLRAGNADLRTRPLVVAHRGWSWRAPENTLAAYKLAIDAGADMAECDVMLSKDGVPVLMHDDTLKRTTGVDKPVSALTTAELVELDAGAWKDKRFAGEKVPTLRQALALTQGKLRFIIEIKERDAALPVLKVIRESGVAPDDLIVFSFSREAVATIAKAEPLLPTSWLLDEVPTDEAALREVFRQALRARTSAIGLSYKKATAQVVRMAHERGFAVFTWTVNRESDMRRMIGLGVDAVITDRPDVLLGVVGR